MIKEIKELNDRVKMMSQILFDIIYERLIGSKSQ